MEFFRQQYWSGLLFPSPGDLPDPGIELASPALQADSLLLSHWVSPKSTQATTEERGEREREMASGLACFLLWNREVNQSLGEHFSI